MKKILSFILGSTSIIGQVLLLRELVTVFYGNETTYAVILASWLFWIAVGSFVVSRLVEHVVHVERWLCSAPIATSLILTLTIIITRFIRTLMHVPEGEMMGIIPMVLICFTLLAPLTMLLGGTFTLLCRKDNAGTIYLWESIGAAVGGLVYSFILIHLFSALHVAFFIIVLNVVAVFLILVSSGTICLSAGRGSRKMLRVSVFGFIVIAFVCSFGLINRLDQWTRQSQWREFELIESTDSIYGHLALIKRHGKYSLFENGVHSYTTDDDLTNEENVHYALLEHPHPKEVLLIGNGVSGGVKEILKHNVFRLDYVELDSKVIDLSMKHLPNDVLASLKDDRVSVIHLDARLLVKRAVQKYDVVIVNLEDPYTALINRYYTVEFFEEVKNILTDGGVISLSVSSSENYLNPETKQFLRSIHTTLRSVFDDVISIPGNTNIFLACKKKGVLTAELGVLIDRIHKRQLSTKYVNEYYIPDRLNPCRVSYINDVFKTKGVLNTDMRPIAYLYDIILWSTHFNLKFKNFIEKIRWIKFKHLLIFPVFVFIGGIFLRRKRKTAPITISIMTTGFSEIIFQLIVIIAFQTLYGFAYYKIGLIMTSFMIGLVLGSFWARQLMQKDSSSIFRVYKIVQSAICIYPLILPAVFILFRDAVTTQNLGFFSSCFAFLPIIAGFMGGVQYPLATYLLSAMQPEGVQKKEGALFAGTLYAADTFGAMIGALLTGVVLIPLLGISSVAFFCATLNVAVLMLLIFDKGR